MKTIITGKNMNVSAGITERVMKKTGKMERYLHTDAEMQVRLTRERNDRRTCEITVPFEGVVLRAEASNDDNLYVCIDQALAKLEKQLEQLSGEKNQLDAFMSGEDAYSDANKGKLAEAVKRLLDNLSQEFQGSKSQAKRDLAWRFQISGYANSLIVDPRGYAGPEANSEKTVCAR